VGFVALLLALMLAPCIGGAPAGVLYEHDVPLNALRALTGIAALLCLPPLPQRRERGGGGVRAVLALIAATLAILSLLVHTRMLTSPVLLFAMLPATLDWICYALLFLLCLRYARLDPRFAFLIAAALGIGATILAVSVAQDYGQMAQSGMRDYRSQGTFFSPNFAAGLLALVLPILSVSCLAVRHRLAALAIGAASAVVFGALVATGSRAGVAIGSLGLAVALLLAAVPARGSHLAIPWLRLAALLAAFALFGFVFRGPLMARGEGGAGGASDEHSGAYRTLTWKGTLAMAKAHPLLGTGPGTFDVRYPRFAIVVKTDLAHSSYLQTAAEAGFPAAVAAAAAVALTFGAAAVALVRARSRDAVSVERRIEAVGCLLLCGLTGGLLAGALRSLFDSEWSLLGDALPFWAVAGLAAGLTARLSPQGPDASNAGSDRRHRAQAVGVRIAGASCLALSLVLLYGDQARDAFLSAVQHGAAAADAAPSLWPPDPMVLQASGHPDDATRIEPSGKMFYQLARRDEASGDMSGAVAALRQAVAADPNAFQIWRRLAADEEAVGDHAGALDAWRELVRRAEGPAGQVRALPELTDTYPAFAYAALAQDAAARGDVADADALDDQAAKVVEAYSRTLPLYQKMEIESASLTGGDVAGRRQELRDLYVRLMADWSQRTAVSQRPGIESRQADTLARLDAMTPATEVGAAVPSS
jgi:O-antigen ligase